MTGARAVCNGPEALDRVGRPKKTSPTDGLARYPKSLASVGAR